MEDPRGWLLVFIIWVIMGLGPFVIGGIICIILLIVEARKRNRKGDSSK